eukprot:Nk52_evm108s151 gene=Nk52_evmTU108s151
MGKVRVRTSRQRPSPLVAGAGATTPPPAKSPAQVLAAAGDKENQPQSMGGHNSSSSTKSTPTESVREAVEEAFDLEMDVQLKGNAALLHNVMVQLGSGEMGDREYALGMIANFAMYEENIPMLAQQMEEKILPVVLQNITSSVMGEEGETSNAMVARLRVCQEAAGALRNLLIIFSSFSYATAAASCTPIEVLISKSGFDLSTFVRALESTLRLFEQVNGNSQGKRIRELCVSYMDQLVNIIVSVCEIHEGFVKSSEVAQVLLPSLLTCVGLVMGADDATNGNGSDANGDYIKVALAAGHCLYILTEQNDYVLNWFANTNPGAVGALHNVMEYTVQKWTQCSNTEASASRVMASELMCLSVVICGVLVSSTLASAPELIDTERLSSLFKVLCGPLEVESNALLKNVMSQLDKVRSAAKKGQASPLVEEVHNCFLAKQMCMEVVSNIMSGDFPGANEEELMEEEMEYESDGNENFDDEMGALSLECFIPQNIKASAVENGVILKVLNQCLAIEPVVYQMLATSPDAGVLLNEALLCQSRAFACLANLSFAFSVAELNTVVSMENVVAALLNASCNGSRQLPETVATNYFNTASSALWSNLKKIQAYVEMEEIKELTVVSPVDVAQIISAMSSPCAKDVESRSNLVGSLGVLLKLCVLNKASFANLPTNSNPQQQSTPSISNTASNTSPQGESYLKFAFAQAGELLFHLFKSEQEMQVIAEALNVLFDVFDEKSLTISCPTNGSITIQLNDILASCQIMELLTSSVTDLKRRMKQAKPHLDRDVYGRINEAVFNLQRFLKYKKQ